ncbi:PorP/SprF family type IX secretion system membrane protein [Adhaeribacter aquaticus]|uniref:PorP/SprF family type IX secretion system membrane protein n=1 Tax=Adhaeribacter aquaticus TaxID=299567 RepID=UPI000424702D|nr:PorP/SprF family type IX secretion system membrane protein [Adhaeribacter aquaticus]
MSAISRNIILVVKRIGILFLLVFGLWLKGVAQDLHFSQQYANRLHLNPAYAGIHADYSAVLTHRNQWPSLNGAFITNQFAGYYRLKNERTTAGLVISTDKAGSTGFTKHQLGGIYAYQSNINEKLAFSAGMQLSYGSQRVDYGALTFGDQLNEDGTVNETSLERNVYDPARYVSVEAGGLIYSNNFWVSFAGYHLNQPNIGFDYTSKLPAKVILNGGYKFVLDKYYYLNKPYEWSISPSLTYTHQGPFKKTDIGVYTTYTPVTFGVLYRGLPFLSNYSYDQSLVVIAGIVFDPIKIGYSYDVPLSGFGARTRGAHEISLSFERIDYNKIFKKRVSGKNYKRIACPSF